MLRKKGRVGGLQVAEGDRERSATSSQDAMYCGAVCATSSQRGMVGLEHSV